MKVNILLLTAIVLSCMNSSVQANTQDLMSRLAQCHSVPNESERLKCYDQLTESPAKVSQPAVVQKPIATIQLTSDQKFGYSDTELKQKTQPAEKEIAQTNQISAQVKNITRLPNGRLKISLSNDQTWVQIAPTLDDWIAVGQTVVIKAGALGSYSLKNEHGIVYKVHRID